MNYRVILQPRAYRDLAEQYKFIAERSPESAARWFNRFLEAIDTLSLNPQRCSIARESPFDGQVIRQLLFGKGQGVRRALFVVDETSVRVLCIRHSARDDATPEDLQGD